MVVITCTEPGHPDYLVVGSKLTGVPDLATLEALEASGVPVRTYDLAVYTWLVGAA